MSRRRLNRPNVLLVTVILLGLLAGCTGGATSPTPAPSPHTPATEAPATQAPATVAAAPTSALTEAASAVPPEATTPAEAASTPAASAAATPKIAPSPQASGMRWWNDRVFYEIFVRSFQDSDGDGIGDFKGLTQRLDYLNDGDPDTATDLGITGIWLMPIMPSPSYHGYDVTDYKDIEPDYGTMEDFRTFLDEAHERGIAVIVDLVMNHTSSQHPWFLESMKPSSDKRDWYVWSDNPTGNGWHGTGNTKYYGAFGDHMPDLNYNNEEVSEAMFDIVRFWLEDVKVDGFRLDAIKYLVEEKGMVEHAPATLKWLEQFYTYYKGVNPDAFTVGEVWSDTMTARSYVSNKVDVVFEFAMAEAMLTAALTGNRRSVERAHTNVNQSYPSGQFATFLANHDQNRVRSRVRNEGQAAVAASLYLLYPGVPFIYYGEEIGQQGKKPDEDIRRPMQWTAEGGFTTGEPWRPYFEDLATRNVDAQDADDASLLIHYRGLIRLRNTHEALRTGEWQPVTVTPEGRPARAVYAYLRALGDERFLVLINLDDTAVSDYALAAEAPEGAQLAGPLQAEQLYGPAVDEIPELESGAFDGYTPVPVLPPFSTFVIQYSP